MNIKNERFSDDNLIKNRWNNAPQPQNFPANLFKIPKNPCKISHDTNEISFVPFKVLTEGVKCLFQFDISSPKMSDNGNPYYIELNMSPDNGNMSEKGKETLLIHVKIKIYFFQCTY